MFMLIGRYIFGLSINPYFIFIFFSVLLLFVNTALLAIEDPTKPAHTLPSIIIDKSNKKTIAEPNLSALFIKNNLQQAIINGRLYQQGDFFLSYKIVSITSKGVLLKNDNGMSQLSLTLTFKKPIKEKR